MSKQQKPKITLELPKKNLVSVSSVFHRLGHKGKEKIPKAQTIVDKKALEVVVDHQMTDSVSAKLQLVRQKAAQIMDSKKQKQETVLADRPQLTVIKTVRPVRRSSSSDSSSSSSASSSSSSSPRRKGKKRNVRKRAPSSSSEERKVVKKHHKKSDKKAHKKARELTKTLVKRAISPSYSRRRESESPPKKIVKVRKEKAYRESREVMREVERDRELYEREKAKARERERVRSPSPKRRSRSPVAVRGVYRSRERSDDRSPYRRNERERKEREYEIVRERERAEALARCQERQRERERIKKLEELERARERRPRSRSYSRERVIRERETYERRPYEEIPLRRSPRDYRRDESPYERPRHYEEEPRRAEYRGEEYHNKHERYEERRGYEREGDWEKPSTSTKEIYSKPPYRREYEGGKEWQKDPATEHYKPGYVPEQKHWDETRGAPAHTTMIKREWTGGPPSYRSPRPRLERPEMPGYRPRIPYQGHRAPFRPRNPGVFNPRHSFHGSSSYFPRVRAPYQPRQPIQIQQPIVTAPVEVVKAPRHEKDEDNLSEISDEADDILAKPEGVFGRQLRARQRQFAVEQKPPVEETLPVDDIKSHANKTLKEEMQLDFEEISDGELDEENKIKSLGDALGVDWGSIVEESKKKIKDDSQSSNAKEKWQAHRILLEVGISTQMAGEEFAAHILKESYEKVKQEVTTQILSAHKATGFDGKQIKDEPKEEEDTKPDIEAKVREILPYTDAELFEKRFAFMQNGFKERLEQRRNLVVHSIGPCSRALSARQDLKIRRRLCGLPEEELVRDILPMIGEEEDVKPQSSIELAFQMFKKATERVC